jgi:hypothetical protein
MQRRIHNRFHIDSRFAPSGREKLKQSEMQNEDHADHSDPAGEHWLISEVGDTEQQNRP